MGSASPTAMPYVLTGDPGVWPPSFYANYPPDGHRQGPDTEEFEPAPEIRQIPAHTENEGVDGGVKCERQDQREMAAAPKKGTITPRSAHG